MSTDTGEPGERRISRNRETIREWADEHEAVPVREAVGGGESDQFRMVPEEQVGESHERVEWEEFFDHLDEGDHVVVYEGSETGEPFEVAGQTDVATRLDDHEIEERLLEGETVTSTITETTVVESVVVEEVTVESELVDTETVDERVIDVELVGQECTDCEFVPDRSVDTRGWFGADSYLDTVREGRGRKASTDPVPEADRGDAPYHAELEVEETWAVTREFVERFVVESHITDTEVTEADTIEDYDIDVSGLHRSIVESGLVREDFSPSEELTIDETLTHYDVESELSDPGRITTTFTRDRTFDEEVVERKRLTADVTDTEIVGTEVVSTEQAAGEGLATEPVAITEDVEGKPVVDANGNRVGVVSAVEAERDELFVDADSSITERIQAALGWGDAHDEDYRLHPNQINRITDDEVELKASEHLE